MSCRAEWPSDGLRDVYRNNFTHMPELSWVLGYPFSLLLMVMSSAAVWIVARRSGWL